ncbi:PadR family transcriptional regulator [Nocardia panacis]|uniref:PadR family transcriptional regulator n=1 Tax=Nocardia panacis TaxID=2340916 RepID=A0A3A4KVX5_9NOCA|nr:PadR family transcriptional regulator [Nocardia panacis]RJO79390.1 PadR family transcriptional regulator [Nocardia panacis]
MTKKRKVNNLTALAVLATLLEKPMHRYEVASKLKQRGKEADLDIKWGSLYTVVQNLEKAGFLEVVGSERDGARPERTIYRITEAGRAELFDWTRELLANPEPESSRFVAGLSIVATLAPDEVVELLDRRVATLRERVAAGRREIDTLLRRSLPRLLLLESEYRIAMLTAEAQWAQSLRTELADGTFPDVEFWRRIHAEGLDLAEVAHQIEKGVGVQE